jgi:predicted nuclease with TOPRIM domain
MAKKVEVEIDVKDNIEASIANLKALKKQLKETAAGTEEFQRLQQSINDMEDSIKSAKTGAANFTEVLGQLPGPIGDIGNKVSGAVNTMKQFGALKFNDIKASFVELKKDFSDALSGLGKLTGITKVYTILNNA